ncbi:hypothetical protein [Arthrobacter sp. NA-172]|uniref:hypothetical protein n=1 Tax=Arthrobacter sp. NA-172 TaxID=3367524 RepID=UPI003754D6C5
MAIAYAREGADVAFTYLPEEEQDAAHTAAVAAMMANTTSELEKNLPVKTSARALGSLR